MPDTSAALCAKLGSMLTEQCWLLISRSPPPLFASRAPSAWLWVAAQADDPFEELKKLCGPGNERNKRGSQHSHSQIGAGTGSSTNGVGGGQGGGRRNSLIAGLNSAMLTEIEATMYHLARSEEAAQQKARVAARNLSVHSRVRAAALPAGSHALAARPAIAVGERRRRHSSW